MEKQAEEAETMFSILIFKILICICNGWWDYKEYGIGINHCALLKAVELNATTMQAKFENDEWMKMKMCEWATTVVSNNESNANIKFQRYFSSWIIVILLS
ncbi:transmembrane protein, putative [Medicago truncatula]|uniref:Transmembrane protein, putative n=1 Tax=Medicago truncatula TaxID=3880 RepID=A0A072U1M7_MEDTR|nr:transmembrane protein, putative [Medicago truncatula]